MSRLSFSRLSLPIGLALAGLALAAVRPAAAITIIAQDDASNPVYQGSKTNVFGTINGNNGGTGFNAFSLVNDGNNSNGSFIAANSPIGSGANANAFNLYNDAGSTVNTIDATRSFNSTNTGTGTTPLVVGSTFSTDFKNSGIDQGGFVGYSLRNSANTVLFKFGFIGYTNDYFFGDGTTSTDTGLTKTDGGLHTSFTLTSPTAYSFSVQRLSDTSPSTFTGSLVTGGAIDRVVFSDNGGGGGSDTQFNNLKITAADVAAAPEPSQLAGLSFTGLGAFGLVLKARKRRVVQA